MRMQDTSVWKKHKVAFGKDTSKWEILLIKIINQAGILELWNCVGLKIAIFIRLL